MSRTLKARKGRMRAPSQNHDLEEGLLDLAVEHEHQSGAHGTERVGASALEESAHALVGGDLLEAVSGAGVDPLLLRLVGLHLEATADGVERVGSVASGDGGDLGTGEGGADAHDGVIGVGERVHGVDGIEEAEVHTTVRDDAHHRHAEAVVKSGGAAGGDGLLEAVHEAGELLLAGADIRGEAGTGVVERVHEAEGAGAGKATGGEVGEEEHAEVLLRGVLREEALDGVLEREVEGLGREVADDVGQVAAPEGGQALLLVHADEAVADAGVARHLAGHDLRVGILGLDDELDALDRGRARLGDGTGRATGDEVHDEVTHLDRKFATESRSLSNN
mmetsp:Transcript_40916/g.128189  ORF Transcript_40916/g.128189 Transcript_40916/m.128189 type:complete len:335 (-) Transcript_40916:2-1006(-)